MVYLEPIVAVFVACSSHAEYTMSSSYSISLPLLHLLKGLHRAMESMSVISPKLRIGALQGWISVSSGLLDAVKVEECVISEVNPSYASIVKRGHC